MNPTSRIHDLVRFGQCAPEQGARLLHLRRWLLWRRKPWWQKAAIILIHTVLGSDRREP